MSYRKSYDELQGLLKLKNSVIYYLIIHHNEFNPFTEYGCNIYGQQLSDDKPLFFGSVEIQRLTCISQVL